MGEYDVNTIWIIFVYALSLSVSGKFMVHFLPALSHKITNITKLSIFVIIIPLRHRDDIKTH